MGHPFKTVFEFEHFRFDADERVLRRGSEVVDITPKALEILLILLENPGRVVPKDEVFRRVWPDSFVEEANLTHHIFRLRKALGETQGKKFIETVSKRGYRFVVEVKGKNAGTAKPAIPSRLGGKWKIAAALALILVLTCLAVYRYSRTSSRTGALEPHPESIAVMPFVNESGNADVDYLSDGMTETLIASLSTIRNLTVKARSSVFRYKGERESGRKLSDRN